MGKAMMRAICALVCFAALSSFAAPPLAEGAEIGTKVTVSIAERFQIKAQTEDFALAINGNQQLRVEVGGVAPFSYAWEVSTDGGTIWNDASDINDAAVYDISNAQVNKDATGKDIPYQYRVTVTNADNDKISAIIKVLVSNNYSYKETEDEDSPADIPPTVSGYIHDSTILHVEPIEPNSDLAPAVWAAMSAKIEDDESYLTPYNIYFTNSSGAEIMHHGQLEIKFNVGTTYNGLTVKIIHYHTATGITETLSGTVVNGLVTVTVHDLCPFMAVVPANTMHIISASSGAGGSISPAGSVSVGHGGDMYFYFEPQRNYIVDKLYIDNVETAVSGDFYHFTNVLEAHSIHVTYRLAPRAPAPYRPASSHTITAAAGEHGRISPAGGIQLKPGDTQTFYFIPDEGYEVDTVIVNDRIQKLSGNSYSISNISRNHTIRVTFKRGDAPVAPPQYHTVSAEAKGNGRISPSGTVQLAPNGAQTFYFLPDDGYQVDTVMVDGTALPVPVGSYRFTDIAGDHRLSVTFKPLTEQAAAPRYHTLSAAAEANGSISPSGEVQTQEGNSAWFYFLPDDGYQVDSVWIDGEKKPVSEDAYCFANIASGHSIRVSFKRAAAVAAFHTVAVSAEGNGHISPEGELRVSTGGAQSFYFTPDEGHAATVYVNGEPQELTGNQYTVENISGDTELAVEFAPLETELSGMTAGRHSLWASLPESRATPWRWLLPALTLLAAAAASWFAVRKRRHT